MTPRFGSWLDAEELHAALSGEAVPEAEHRHGDLLRTVALLREHEPVQPRPAFLSGLRRELLLTAQTDLVATPTPIRGVPARQSLARRGLITAAASLIVVCGTAGVAVAAQGAVPGDPLYPVKRGGEEVETLLRLNEAGRGHANLRQAEQRVSEAAALQAADADASQIIATVEDFRISAESGTARLLRSYLSDSDPDDVTAVREFAADQLPALEALGAADDPAIEPVLLDAADTLAALDQQTRALCESCGGPVALAPPEAMGSTASAASLDVLLARPAEQARLDADAITELDRHQVAELVERADEVATEPLLPSGEEWPVAATPETRTPVDTELAPVGRPLEDTVAGTTRAVDDLVTGLGDVVGTKARMPPDTPSDEPVRELADTVDAAVEGVTDVTGGITGSLTD